MALACLRAGEAEEAGEAEGAGEAGEAGEVNETLAKGVGC